MTADIRWFRAFAVSGLVVAWGCASAAGQKRYDVGVTDSEIKIGNLMPYSAPASLRCDRHGVDHECGRCRCFQRYHQRGLPERLARST
jgi:hypothetical protein